MAEIGTEVLGLTAPAPHAALTSTIYAYDPFDDLLGTEVGGHASTDVVNTYDIRGRKRTLHDPDLSPGTGQHFDYVYYAFADEGGEDPDRP